jgi:hypothetical protein
MKYLHNYTDELQKKLLTETGSFFAFSKKQLDEQAEPETHYTHVGAGLLVPREKVPHVIQELEAINFQGITMDVADHGMKAIIHRELGNYEVQISNDLTNVYTALSEYPVTQEEIQAEYREYYQTCIENDWF